MPDLHFSPRPNRAADIDWMEWGTNAFERATRENKPILLAISAVWCHWCHVMDETSYSDPGVIDAIARNYVAVRVDNDRRPDVNARYNLGGWPTTAFLASDGSLLTGGTYIPPEQMRRALDDVADFYRNNAGEIERRATEIAQTRDRIADAGAATLERSVVERLVDGIAARYDAQYGGFGDAPKFPQTDVLELLIAMWRCGGDERLLSMVAHTLRAMSAGATYDRVEGGFFRYSTTRDWSVPHFEKMAEDHAGLIRVLSQLVLWGGADEFRDVLRDVLRYVHTTLLDSQTHLFAGSQDADESYFALPAEERSRRPAPYVDRTSYSNWTAGLAGACVWAARALDDDAVMAGALTTLDALHAHLRDDAGLLYHFVAPDGAPRVRGLLTDQVAYLRAIVDAHAASGQRRFLQRATAHADAVLEHFGATGGGFYDRAPQLAETALGRLDVPDRPVDLNGAVAGALLQLAASLERADYHAAAESALRAAAPALLAAGTFGATMAIALMRYLEPQMVVRIVGTPEESAPLRREALLLPGAFVDVVTLSGHEAHGVDLPSEPAPAAYACAGTACAAPALDAAALRRAFAGLVRS